MGVDEDRLLVRLEASATKLVSEMAKASAYTKQRMKEIDDTVAGSNRRLTQRLGEAGAAYRKGADGGRAYGMALQNASYQIGDFAVQVAAGTSATRAMAMQLPQLLGGFGVFGAVAGAVAAIALPLASNWMAAGDTLKEINALSLDQVRSRIDELKTLQADYNEVVRASGPVQSAATREKLGALDIEYQAKLELFRLDAIQLEQRKRQLEASIAAQRAQVEAMRADLDLLPDPDAGSADYTRTQRQSAELAQLQEMIAANQDLFLEIRKQSAELDLVNLSIGDIQSALSGAVGLAGSLALGFSGAADEAARAAAAAARISPFTAPDANGRVVDRGQLMANMAGRGLPTAAPAYEIPRIASRGGGGGGGGGGAATSDPRQFLQDRLEAARAAAEAAQVEAESILKGSVAAATLKAKLDLLAEAKRKNLDLDKVNAQTGITLRAEIDQQAAAIAKLTTEASRYQEQSQFLKSELQDLQNGFIDAAIEGKSMSEVLQGLAKDLAKAALQAALFGTGPFAGAGGGAGFGGLLSGLFGGARADGGPVQAGKAYLVGERGPELMMPATAGRIVPNHALRGGGGGEVGVRVFVDQDGNWQAKVERISGAVSARVVGGAMQVQRRGLAAEITNQQARGAR